jgi:YbbR domain-containing protein
MKTMKTIFTLAGIALVAFATAVEKPKMNVIPLESDRAVVALSNENPAYFEINVKARNGSTVYYKQSNKKLTDYSKVFDFSDLEDGTYEISMKVNDTKIKREIEIEDNKINVGDAKISYDPYVCVSGNILKVSFLNFDKENIDLQIYNNEGLVYRSNIGNEFTVNTGYDISNLEAGNYEVVVSADSDSYSYSIKK